MKEAPHKTCCLSNVGVLLITEDGETDSFIGQGSNLEDRTQFNCFQPQAPGGATGDLFTQINTSPPSMLAGSPMPPHMVGPPNTGMVISVCQIFSVKVVEKSLEMVVNGSFHVKSPNG